MPTVGIAVALAILLAAQAAYGMDWRVAEALPDDPNKVVVTAIGVIKPDEGQIFDRFFSRAIEKPGLSIAAVALISRGGAVQGAFDLADRVNRLKLPTATLDGQPCASACVIVWASGSPRMLLRSAAARRSRWQVGSPARLAMRKRQWRATP